MSTHNITSHEQKNESRVPRVPCMDGNTANHRLPPIIRGEYIHSLSLRRECIYEPSQYQTSIDMRKITKQAVQAFEQMRPFKSGNTEVRVIPQNGGSSLVLLNLHGNTIARHEAWNGNTYITHCGWNTLTTKERLNGLDGVSISQKKGVWYLNGKEWDGRLINPKTGKKPLL